MLTEVKINKKRKYIELIHMYNTSRIGTEAATQNKH